MKKIEFSCELFSEKNIEQALADYKKIANTSIKKSDKYYIVRFWSCKYNESRTIKEFENYLIGLENN